MYNNHHRIVSYINPKQIGSNMKQHSMSYLNPHILINIYQNISILSGNRMTILIISLTPISLRGLLGNPTLLMVAVL